MTFGHAKGRLKEAAGALTGYEDLKKEGQLDQEAAVVKESVVIDKAKDLVGCQKKNEYRKKRIFIR